jgi:hypothetical protein
VLDLSRWKGFGKDVHNHVVSRAVNKLNRPVFDNILNEVESTVDVLGMGMVLVVLCKCNSRLIV